MSKKVFNIDDYLCEVVSEEYNALIKRREVLLKIQHVGKGTPSRSVIREAVAKFYNVNVDQVVVKKIETEYGWGVTNVHIHIYPSVEQAKLFEPEYVFKRHGA